VDAAYQDEKEVLHETNKAKATVYAAQTKRKVSAEMQHRADLNALPYLDESIKFSLYKLTVTAIHN